jgi:hypothetical protein
MRTDERTRLRVFELRDSRKGVSLPMARRTILAVGAIVNILVTACALLTET